MDADSSGPLHYAIERGDLAKLRRIAARLYTENRLTGDDMRDFAHLLSLIADGAIPLDHSDKE